MSSSIKTLPAIRHALVNRYRRLTPVIKIPKDMARIDESHPDLTRWIRRSKDDSVVWLKDIKIQEKGVKTSRDIDPSKYVMLNEGYFHSPSNAAPFLYVRREDINNIAKDYRNSLIETYKSSSEVEKLAGVFHALIEMGELNEYSDDAVDQTISLIHFLGRKKPRAETIAEARLKSKLHRITRTFSVQVIDRQTINIKSLNLRKNGNLQVSFKSSSTHRSWSIWDSFSLISEVNPNTLEAAPEVQHAILSSCVLDSETYRHLEKIQMLADQHRKEHNLTHGQIRDRLQRISQMLDLSIAKIDDIAREMDLLDLLMSTYEQAEFKKRKDGIAIVCYLAPSLEAKQSKVAVAELNFTLPFSAPDQYRTFMDEVIASLPQGLVYPVSEGKQLSGKERASGKSKKKHKKKEGKWGYHDAK